MDLAKLYEARAGLRKNLDILLLQRIQYGELSVPLSILNSEQLTREQLQRIEAAIRLAEPEAERVETPMIVDNALTDVANPLMLARAIAELQQQFYGLRGSVFSATGHLDLTISDIRQQLGKVEKSQQSFEGDARSRFIAIQTAIDDSGRTSRENTDRLRIDLERWRQNEDTERKLYQQKRLRLTQLMMAAIFVLILVALIRFPFPFLR